DRPVRFLIHDRDAKFPRAFDTLLAAENIKVIRTLVQAPNANAHVERWVGSVRRECLDRLVIVGRRQLEHVLSVYLPPSNRPLPPGAAPPRARPASARGAQTSSHGSSPGAAGSSAEPPRPARRPHPRVRHRRRRVTIEFLHPTSRHAPAPYPAHTLPPRPNRC